MTWFWQVRCVLTPITDIMTLKKHDEIKTSKKYFLISKPYAAQEVTERDAAYLLCSEHNEQGKKSVCLCDNRLYSFFFIGVESSNKCVPSYSYFEKGCRKKCTRQSQKVLWVVLNSLLFKEVWKNDTRGHVQMFVSAERKQRKQFRQLQCQEQCIDHIPYYLSGLSRAHFVWQPILK